ncbi:LuxR C-terminal-related transcriptional regulator [Georgenia sp. Z1344]|uniref:LuxR C-terminal-related transcriptional regulator n=1 Tax=Georgenia sp. Z1344 TaxID=3416706 RepID=UPI003CE7E04F
MRLVVADDAALLREGLVGLLERQGHDVVAQAASAPELEAVVEKVADSGEAIDVVVTDVRMPPGDGEDGLRAAARIRAAHPEIGILVLSQYAAPAYAAELFAPLSDPAAASSRPDVGGLGYLLKERVARVADFMRSLGIVAAGGVVADPDVVSRLVAGRRTAVDTLTVREREVLELMASGLSNSQIAERLVLSNGAVAKHVANVFSGLGLAANEENRRVRAVLAYLTAVGP